MLKGTAYSPVEKNLSSFYCLSEEEKVEICIILIDVNEGIRTNARTQKVICSPSPSFRVKSAISMSFIVGDCVSFF